MNDAVTHAFELAGYARSNVLPSSRRRRLCKVAVAADQPKQEDERVRDIRRRRLKSKIVYPPITTPRESARTQ